MAQFLRPDTDVDDGEFLPSTGSDLYAVLDESSPDDGDYVYATGNGDFTVALSAGTDPVSSSDHVARYRAKGNGVADLRVTLLEDSTPIASWTEPAAAATFTNYSHTLSGGEADSITDYTALRFKMEVGDFTAPSLSSASDGTPTADGAEDAGVDTDEGNGTLYWAVLTDGGSCTDAQLKAGSGGNIVAGKAGNQAVSGTGTQTISDITGLSASTNYEIVFLHRDAAGNDSAQASVGLTTEAGSGDPNWDDVVLLAFNETGKADANTDFADQSTQGVSLTEGGNVQWDTAQFPTGTDCSVLYDGTGDYVNTGTDADLALGTTWTIELWFRTVDNSLTRQYLLTCDNGNDLRLSVVADNISMFVDGDFALTTSGITNNTWHHIAATCDSGTLRLFLDGVNSAGTYSVTANFTATAFEIGAIDNGADWPVNGHLRSLRITKGVARYTGNFTPPSLPLPSS